MRTRKRFRGSFVTAVTDCIRRILGDHDAIITDCNRKKEKKNRQRRIELSISSNMRLAIISQVLSYPRY